MKVTKIKKSGGFYEIVLNNDIKISGIFFADNTLEFPKYEGKNKNYKQFSILNRNFKNYLLQSLLNNKTLTGEFSTSFKINKMSVLKNNKNLKAFVSVIFNDDIEVECRIINGKNGLWVAWPSSLKNNVWVKNFRFINKNLQNNVEKKLITDYTSLELK
ncbi:MAG: SpoVG family protein [Endomicrobium sp.]|jgi:DNA-binding cell septation regulator SpoVG|nr:SpoVG family protein [Endomicrobium sp.]